MILGRRGKLWCLGVDTRPSRMKDGSLCFLCCSSQLRHWFLQLCLCFSIYIKKLCQICLMFKPNGQALIFNLQISSSLFPVLSSWFARFPPSPRPTRHLVASGCGPLQYLATSSHVHSSADPPAEPWHRNGFRQDPSTNSQIPVTIIDSTQFVPALLLSA